MSKLPLYVVNIDFISILLFLGMEQCLFLMISLFINRVYDSLGEVFAKMGKLKKAKEWYQKSLELDPNNMNAAEVLKHLD